MASRLFFGFLLLFTLVSFVPPGVGKEIKNLPVGIDGDLPVVVRSGVTDTVRTVAAFIMPEEFPMTKEEITETAKEEGMSALKAFIFGSSEAEEAYDGWKEAMDVRPDVAEILLAIETARETYDVRACHDLPAVQGASRGDYLAYCLARVTRDPKRCDQIDPVSIPNLKSLCNDELRGAQSEF